MKKEKVYLIIAILVGFLFLIIEPIVGALIIVGAIAYWFFNRKNGELPKGLDMERKQDSAKIDKNDWAKKPLKPKQIILFVIIVALFIFAIVKIVSVPTSQPTQVISQAEKEDAQKQLDNIISLGKQSGLVVSYEFSDSASVVYVGNVWYSQTVQFKKDFVAKIGMLKKQITGYKHFEIRNAYSNEKVAELTAFSGSIEVYK